MLGRHLPEGSRAVSRLGFEGSGEGSWALKSARFGDFRNRLLRQNKLTTGSANLLLEDVCTKADSMIFSEESREMEGGIAAVVCRFCDGRAV